jgi:hypothetical protein
MKQLISVVLVLGLVLGNGLVYGATTDTVNLTVSCRNLSVNIKESSLGFGTVNAGATAVTGSSATVTNDGNWNTDYQLQTANSTPSTWTPITTAAPATNTQYRLLALFNNNTTPVGGDFNTLYDYLLTSAQTSTVAAGNGIFEGTQDGDTVSANAELGLWFRLEAPAGNPSSAQQTIQVTMTAAAAD